jgi:hypothetical protein
MKFISVLFSIFLSFRLLGQQANMATHYAATIDSNTLKTHVYKLASTEFQGRETGTEGNLKAAQYIAGQLASYGIQPIPGDGDYFQEVAFSKIAWENDQLTINGNTLEHLKDFLSIPQYSPELQEPLHIETLTFLGYGIDDEAYSDYKGKNVRDQTLLVLSGEPKDRRGNFRITGTANTSSWSEDPMLKVEAAKKAGAKAIFIIDENLRDHVTSLRKNMLSGRTIMGSLETLSADYIPNAFLSSEVANQLIALKKKQIVKIQKRINKRGESGSVNIPANIDWNATHSIQTIPGNNVLGFIEGTDPKLKNEIVVVSAHYYHLGMSGKDIYFGADDNASGTSAVLEIAQAMAEAKANGDGPRRSVLCMLMTGEEKGLWGSEYYSEHPVFPLENTVADVNIDMIGRIDTLHTQSNYTYVIGSDRLSTDLHKINESVNQQYTHLNLDYTYNADDDPNRFYYRSDHYNFAKNGIPAIFYFSGVHEDYHRPTDTPDKLMYGKAQTIAQLAFYTVWELANRDERIKVDVTGRN